MNLSIPEAEAALDLDLSATMENANIDKEMVINQKEYHTVYEAKNGLGPAPIKTKNGWLHLAHGVRHTAAGLRYVCYMFMTSLDDITLVIHHPAGYFMAPKEKKGWGMSPMFYSATGGLPMRMVRFLFTMLHRTQEFMSRLPLSKNCSTMYMTYSSGRIRSARNS